MSRIRYRWLAVLGLAIISLGMAYALAPRGWLRTIRIVGDSMVPAFYGDHLEIKCEHCQSPLAVALYTPDSPTRETTCTSCGQLTRLPERAKVRRGDRVLLSPARFPPGPAARWEAVALKLPAPAKGEAIKRLVGFPGERVTLSNGDLLINDKVAQKSLEELRVLAVPVVDTGWIGSTESNDLWRPWHEESDDAWSFTNRGFIHVGDVAVNQADAHSPTQVSSDELTGSWDWLRYVTAEVPGRASQSALVLDDYAFNHSVSRRLYPVSDVLVQFSCEGTQPTELAVRLDYDSQFWQVEVRKDPRRLEVHDATGKIRSIPLKKTRRRDVTLEVAFCDRRLLIGIDGAREWAVDGLPQLQHPGPLRVLRVGLSGDGVRVQRLGVARDLHYWFDESSESSPQALALGPREYFVLGDNVPRSLDSRQLGPITRDEVLGLVTPR